MPEASTARSTVADERAFPFDDRDFRRACRLIHAYAGIQLQPHKRDMREIAECSRSIDTSVADAVRSLQFEDIATQALTAVNVHLDRLSAINREASALQELLHKSGGQAGAELKAALGQLGQRIAQMRGDWERPPHKPVMQQSMDAGSVELF